MAEIGVITAVLSLMVAIVSAIASSRSASAALESAKQASQSERRAILRDVVIASQGTIGELGRIDYLANLLSTTYRDLAVHTKGVGGSREKLFLRRIDERKEQFGGVADEAGKYTTDPHALHDMSSEDLLRAISRLEAYRVRAQYMREEFETELASIEGEIRSFRERALAKPI